VLGKVPTVNFGEANFTPKGSFGDNHILIGGATLPLHKIFSRKVIIRAAFLPAYA